MKKFSDALWLLAIILTICLFTSLKPAAADQIIRTLSRNIAVTPTITAGIYSANDAVGGLMIFDNATESRKSAVALNVTVVDKAEQSAVLAIVCLNETFTAVADNAPFNILDADAFKFAGIFIITGADYTDIGGSTVASVSGFNALFTSNDKKLYCQMFTTGTPTYASTSDLQITMGFLHD